MNFKNVKYKETLLTSLFIKQNKIATSRPQNKKKILNIYNTVSYTLTTYNRIIQNDKECGVIIEL